MDTYTNQIVINKPRSEVVKFFADFTKFTKWQPDLKKYDVYEGSGLENGAKALLVFHLGDHDNLKAISRIKENRLPDYIKMHYDTDGVQNYQTIKFQSLTESKTLMIIDSDYDMDGLMKILKVFDKNHFHKRTDKYLNNFKEFVEGY